MSRRLALVWEAQALYPRKGIPVNSWYASGYPARCLNLWISLRTGWPGVRTLWLGEVASLVCSFRVCSRHNFLSRSVPEIQFAFSEMDKKEPEKQTSKFQHAANRTNAMVMQLYMYPSTLQKSKVKCIESDLAALRKSLEWYVLPWCCAFCGTECHHITVFSFCCFWHWLVFLCFMPVQTREKKNSALHLKQRLKCGWKMLVSFFILLTGSLYYSTVLTCKVFSPICLFSFLFSVYIWFSITGKWPLVLLWPLGLYIRMGQHPQMLFRLELRDQCLFFVVLVFEVSSIFFLYISCLFAISMFSDGCIQMSSWCCSITVPWCSSDGWLGWQWWLYALLPFHSWKGMSAWDVC